MASTDATKGITGQSPTAIKGPDLAYGQKPKKPEEDASAFTASVFGNGFAPTGEFA